METNLLHCTYYYYNNCTAVTTRRMVRSHHNTMHKCNSLKNDIFINTTKICPIGSMLQPKDETLYTYTNKTSCKYQNIFLLQGWSSLHWESVKIYLWDYQVSVKHSQQKTQKCICCLKHLGNTASIYSHGIYMIHIVTVFICFFWKLILV